eukprot:s1853_g5.t2
MVEEFARESFCDPKKQHDGIRQLQRAVGAGSWASARVAGSPPPLPDDPVAPFLHPSSRPLLKVPLEFNSLSHWCEVIGNNILAEFWYMFKEARSNFSGFGGAAGDGLIVDNAPPEGLGQCLILLDRQPRIVTSQKVLAPGKFALKLRGGSVRSGQVRSLGYVGSFLAEYSAALELRRCKPSDMTNPMRAILEPKVDLPGDFAKRPVNAALVPMGMKYVAAYLMAALAGKDSPSADDIKKILESVESEYDESIASKLVSELDGKTVHEVVAEGKEKLKGFGGGGGGGPAIGGGGGAAAPAAEAKKEPAAAAAAAARDSESDDREEKKAEWFRVEGVGRSQVEEEEEEEETACRTVCSSSMLLSWRGDGLRPLRLNIGHIQREVLQTREKGWDVNPSQRAAIEGLRYAVEKIQGPPGTGKSTTIFHILDARLPAGQRVLVTCSRNVAVESIAQKLEGLQGWPLCVFGSRDRVGGTARRYLLDSQCACGLAWLLVLTGGLHVQIMVTSKQTSLDRRMILREAIGSCLRHLPKEHDVELLFFMGDLAAASADVQQSLAEEEEKFRDLIFVGGPDADPPVERDVTYVLERPTARGFRLAVGTAWLATHRTDLDFVMYLDDDSYLNVPRLLSLLEVHNSPSLAMGYIMETELDMLDTHICKVCPLNCEACQIDGFLQAFCGKFPEMSLGGCAFLIHQCKLFGQDTAEAPLEECVRKAQLNTMKVVHYFGARGAPRWFLGMGWVFGRRIVDFLARNVGDLKKQGAADVQLGFWLAPLEGVYWVDMKDGQFHDYPMPGSTFSRGCSDQTVLVHRMNKERWRDFDPETCALRCPLTAQTT